MIVATELFLYWSKKKRIGNIFGRIKRLSLRKKATGIIWIERVEQGTKCIVEKIKKTESRKEKD